MDRSSLIHDRPGRHVGLPFDPRAVSLARSIVGEQIGDAPPELVDDAVLLTSELVSNAVLHGEPPLFLAVRADDDAVTVAVTDASAAEPAPPPVASQPDEARGRGLRIVDYLASAWGVERGDTGKTVWFHVGALRRRRAARPSSIDSN